MRVALCLAVLLQATFSVRTEMVVLPVTVTDARGHSVTGLTAVDFAVLDEGRPQAISLFRSGEIPVTVGLVVDHSMSMGPKLRRVAAAAAVFARSGNARDEMFVVSFNERARRVPFASGKLFASSPAELQAVLAAEIPGGATALYDAVAEALRQLPAGQAERKALILVTDGGDNASQLKYKTVRDMARRSRAVIYGVGLVGADNYEESPEKLKQLCRDSGGEAYFPKVNDDVASVFAQIGRDLREQYTIGFVPDRNASGHIYHSLKVTSSRTGGPKLRIRTRAGYIAGPPQ